MATSLTDSLFKSKATRRLIHFALFIIIAWELVGALSQIMIHFDHNEHMYICSSYLVYKNNILYKDFAYLQTPYLPILYSTIYKTLNTKEYYLLIGKIVSFLFLLLATLSIFLTTKKISNNHTIALTIATLFLANSSIIIPASETSNYISPLAVSLISTHIFLTAFSNNKIRHLYIFISGSLLGICVGLKLTHLFILPAFLITIIVSGIPNTNSLHNRFIQVKALSYLLFGISTGLSPLLFYSQDIDVLSFNNYGYHQLNTKWRLLTGYGSTLFFKPKLSFALNIFKTPINICLILSITLISLIKYYQFLKHKNSSKFFNTETFLTYSLFIFSLIAALAPSPSFPQYYAMPISFLYILIATPFKPKSQYNQSLENTILSLLTLISTLITIPETNERIYILSKGQNNWSSIKIHNSAKAIQTILNNHAHKEKYNIATLSPLYAIESNLSIYPEFSSGPFLYRVGDLLTSSQRMHYTGTSPNSLHQLFLNNPPDAIIVGFEDNLDKPFIDYALSNSYKQIKLKDFDGILFIK